MIVVFRLDHRRVRDQRITTHCALVARAFGADVFIYSGDMDNSLEDSIREVNSKWGGKMVVEYTNNPIQSLRSYKRDGFRIVHLTMYGIPFEERVNELNDKLVIVVGGSKVPGEIYEIADYNLSIGNQPHSEVAALGIFMYNLRRSPDLSNAKIRIIPSERGKKIIRID
ncbi:MAG: tRNA (cytidine(56)-2'-O)-methyltransferase [Candidatus Micrarchaeota archaeon]|nr:tRNA (cytidine(56)-2'-O)-methyltransferase [Candidatus Micrarchaeota archaeon]MCX8154368.1 tRNA (cytidine(56)-2'-O)-methyltransferase [Candidatus Micrarchaeota archaeon]